MSDEKQFCLDCDWWHRNIDGSDSNGKCCYHAPKDGHWATAHADDWCGDRNKPVNDFLIRVRHDQVFSEMFQSLRELPKVSGLDSEVWNRHKVQVCKEIIKKLEEKIKELE